MTRAKASALVLVNWKGVFFERYLLDRHVTALEGANGAGKTTVMIAAYLVLLPDLARLRFTNVGETGATGGDRGIWGRLGEPSRPSYAALQLDLPNGERVVAGVMLERRSEPSVDATTFLISQVAQGVRLSEVFLSSGADHDEVPTLDELRNNILRVDAHFKVFKTLKEYFATLFELGCSPMRLVSDEDRNKLNEMLRTSMTGGISRALTSELRSFVLKQESGLGDALGRMRANLDTCRRTRLEVGEARQLEHELSGIYEAALAMARAAQAATRSEAAESASRVAEVKQALASAEARQRAFETSAAEAEGRQRTIADRLASARAQMERAGLAKARILRARETATRLRDQLRELDGVRGHAGELQHTQAKAAAARAATRRDRERAAEAFGRTAEGLANLQTGLDELHRQAHAHRLVQQKLAEARRALGQPGLDEHTLADARAQVLAQLEAVDGERARRDREAQLAAKRQADYDQALAALQQLDGPGLAAARDPEGRHVCARRALARLNEWEALSQRSRELGSEKLRCDALGERQLALFEQGRALGLSLDPQSAAEKLVSAGHAAETDLTQIEELQLKAVWHAHEAKHTAEITRTRVARLEERAERWLVIEAAETRLRTHAPGFEKSTAGLRALLETLESRLDELRAERSRAETALEQSKTELRSLESGAGTVAAELLLLADSVDGELLAGRFEDLDVDEARIMEARLGPLVDAIIVDDPQRCAEKLRGQPRTRAELWLVAADAELPNLEGGQTAEPGHDVMVFDGGGLRLSRIPPEPRLGKKARERRIAELGARTEELSASVEQASRALRETDTNLRAARTLLGASSLWLAGDPRGALQGERDKLIELEQTERTELQRAHEHREAATTARARVAALRDLAREAETLGTTDYKTRSAELAESLERAIDAQERLSRAAIPRKTLAERVDILGFPPPDPSLVAEWERDRARLDAERDRWYGLSEALEAIESNRQAFLWSDAARALTERTELVPELKAQHERARELLEAADRTVESAEQEWEARTAEWQKADAEVAAIQAHVERTRLELESEGASNYSDDALVQANVELARQEQTLAILQEEEHSLAADVAIAGERAGQAHELVKECREKLEAEQKRAEPTLSAWKAFQEAVESTGGAALAGTGSRPDIRLEPHADIDEDPDGSDASVAQRRQLRTSAEYWPEASSKSELLVDRLEAARGGQELANRLRESLSKDSGAAATHDGRRFLEAWLAVRDLLWRRLPAQVADVTEPLEALDRLRQDLEQLERRLTRQESDLGGASEDVARGIEVQIRRAAAQIRRLNQHLDGISFGSIGGIRTRMKRAEKMDQVLSALRDGAVQELLFQPTMPIEDALDEIFKRYGAGKSGGQRLLDYREYVELTVEIQRRTSDDWELANPTRLSTGEAIGVGAALMMVILTEWERDANLLRSKQSRNSLRFLFLDEANRLSQDNLGVLFDLCRNLDLQLLIAAPEVAQAEGNTTYRLVRRITEEGREEVLVSGRRSSMPDEAPRRDAAPLRTPAQPSFRDPEPEWSPAEQPEPQPAVDALGQRQLFD